MKVTATVHASNSSLPIEISGRLWWTRHDWQTSYFGYKTRIDDSTAKGTPAMVRGADSENEEMPCWYQQLWFDSLCYFAPGRSEAENLQVWKDYTSSIKAYTNEWGTDKGRCCITGRNSGKQLAKQSNATSSGNVFIGVPGKTKRFSDGWAQAILVLDKDYPITWQALLATPFWRYFMHTATVITKFAPVRPYVMAPSTLEIPHNIHPVPTKVDPFPHNQAYPTQISPVPQASFNGDQDGSLLRYGIHCRMKYFYVDRLAPLPDGEVNISSFVQ